MRRLNTPASCLDTGMATLDLGDGLTTELPLGKSFIVRENAGRTVSIWDYLNNREQMIYGDTGTRDITTLIRDTHVAGGIYLSRSGNTVRLYIKEAKRKETTADNATIVVVPSGFMPNLYEVVSAPTYGVRGSTGNRALLNTSGAIQVFDLPDTLSSSMAYTRFMWITSDPWPTTLPGVAV